jgi:YfiH family protein
MSLPAEWLVPDWPAPANVRAFVTTRAGGVSEGEYGAMNLGYSSGDVPERVARNREIVGAHLPSAPRWLRQVHGIGVLDLDKAAADEVTADAVVTATPGRVAEVLTADCMPLFFCDVHGRSVGVAHAGWRGMAAGVVEATVHTLAAEPREVLAWMGPAIGPDAFEVGPEVREAFVRDDTEAGGAFRSHRPGKFMADLYALARRRLQRAGVERIYGGGFCTFHEAERFFSYRRVKASGRMGSFIWTA